MTSIVDKTKEKEDIVIHKVCSKLLGRSLTTTDSERFRKAYRKSMGKDKYLFYFDGNIVGTVETLYRIDKIEVVFKPIKSLD